MVSKLESTLDNALNKNAPVKLPPDARKGLAGILWIVSLVFGILELWFAYMFWAAGHVIDRGVDYVNSLSNYYGGPVVTVHHLGPFYYLSLLAMVATAVLLLLSVPGLKARKKSGWDFVFYSMIVEAVVAVVVLFSSVGGGFGNFFGSAITAVIGAYLLFQVRDYFTGAPVPAEHTTHKAEKHAEKAEKAEEKDDEHEDK